MLYLKTCSILASFLSKNTKLNWAKNHGILAKASSNHNITDIINQRTGRQQRLTHSKLQICKVLSKEAKCIYSLCKHDASKTSSWLNFLLLDEKQLAMAYSRSVVRETYNFYERFSMPRFIVLKPRWDEVNDKCIKYFLVFIYFFNYITQFYDKFQWKDNKVILLTSTYRYNAWSEYYE